MCFLAPEEEPEGGGACLGVFGFSRHGLATGGLRRAPEAETLLGDTTLGVSGLREGTGLLRHMRVCGPAAAGLKKLACGV